MVGVIGLGGMGSGIAATLLRKSFELMVFDIEPERVEKLAAAGAASAHGISELCDRCETIVLSLPSSHVAVDVMENQLLPTVRGGSVVIDTGTTLVRATRRLHAAFAECGAHLIDAPVSGGTQGAATGELFIFVGGEKPVVESRWALLQALGGARLTWCGASGSGQVTKGVNQLAMGLVDAAFIEAVAFGVNAGVDARTLLNAVGGESGFRAHFARISAAIARGDGDGNDVKYAEFSYFLDEAKRGGFPVPMLNALHEYMSRFPQTGRDNMNRPYPPLWSALTGGAP